MLIQAMVQTPIPGQLDRFNRFLQMNMALAAAHGVGTSLKVSSFGTAGIEIYLMQQFANWEEYGEKTDAMRGDPAWRQIMDFGGGNQPFAENIDSFCASAIPDFVRVLSMVVFVVVVLIVSSAVLAVALVMVALALATPIMSLVKSVLIRRNVFTHMTIHHVTSTTSVAHMFFLLTNHMAKPLVF